MAIENRKQKTFRICFCLFSILIRVKKTDLGLKKCLHDREVAVLEEMLLVTRAVVAVPGVTLPQSHQGNEVQRERKVIEVEVEAHHQSILNGVRSVRDQGVGLPMTL